MRHVTPGPATYTPFRPLRRDYWNPYTGRPFRTTRTQNGVDRRTGVHTAPDTRAGNGLGSTPGAGILAGMSGTVDYARASVICGELKGLALQLNNLACRSDQEMANSRLWFARRPRKGGCSAST